MAEPVGALRDDFAARLARGDRPDVRDYLARAGPGASELAPLLDGLLMRTPPPDATPDELAAMRALIGRAPPLLAVRQRRGVSRSAVAGALMAALGIDPGQRRRVERRYHELESGLLEPSRVDERVLGAVAAALGVARDAVIPWRAPQAPGASAYRRSSGAEAAGAAAPMRMAAQRPADPGAAEVDRLFGVDA